MTLSTPISPALTFGYLVFVVAPESVHRVGRCLHPYGHVHSGHARYGGWQVHGNLGTHRRTDRRGGQPGLLRVAAYAVGFALRYAVGPRTTPLTDEYTSRAGHAVISKSRRRVSKGPPGLSRAGVFVTITLVREREGCGRWSLTVR